MISIIIMEKHPDAEFGIKTIELKLNPVLLKKLSL